MAFPNVSDILSTTIEHRGPTIADNVTKNAALLLRLKKKGNVKTVAGGHLIREPLSFAENGNGTWYSGYETLPVNAQDVISAADYSWKQLACPVTISGLELRQNAGKEGLIDLLESRVKVAESTMANLLTVGVYSDGTGTSSKQLTGIDATMPADPTTGTYGSINRATYTFWRPQLNDVTLTSANVQEEMTELWVATVRGADHPDLIAAGNTAFKFYMASLQANQRFTDPELATAGFTNVKFMNADVVLDGGVGGAADAEDMYFINTDYLFLRPHKDANMIPLPDARPVNQDAVVKTILWMGNITCSNSSLQGRLKGD